MLRYCLVLMLIPLITVAEGTQTLVEIDSKARELRVFRDGRMLLTLNPVSVGRWGVTASKRRGDGKTPLGTFRVTWFQPEGQFGPFFGIDYPSLERAENGLEDQLISLAQFDAIKSAHARGRTPPQNTALGGYIGIHGLGRADPDIHHAIDWTRGCIAVTNEEMAQLVQLISIGTTVKIR